MALPDTKDQYPQQFGFHDPEHYTFQSRKGLSAEVVREMSAMKGEPSWMLDFRLKALDIFTKKPMPTWGGNIDLDFDDITYYTRPSERTEASWDDVPADIKNTFDKLGIPEAERKFLAGAGAQYESEMVYHSLQEHLKAQGVIFLSSDDGLRQHPELFREHFGTIITPMDNKFAACNSAVWSGGSFLYVPKGVEIEMPLQAYFRLNAEGTGQFERTLIIVDEGAKVHYVEGCLPLGEQVSLGDRWVNIENVKSGDIVMNSDGVEASVSKTRTLPFKGNLVKLVPISSENALQVTPEHPVLGVKRRDVQTPRAARKNWLPEVITKKLLGRKPEFIPAGKLKRGDFMVFPISKTVRPDPILTPSLLKLLGYYLAEGSTYMHKTLKQPIVSFSFNEQERELIEDAKQLIKTVTKKNAMEIHQKSRHGTEVRVYSQHLMDLCVLHCGRHASQKQLSKQVMEQPPKLQALLLGTYLQGDGSVYLKRKHTMIRACTVSQALAWQLQELIGRQGHFATINIRKGGQDTILGRTIHRRNQFIIYYSPDKQQSEVRRSKDHFLVPIKHIDHTPYDGPVFNFELSSKPNAYVARGFAVHNCTAPSYSRDSFHSGVIEIIVKKGAHCRYTTIQNWSTNVYNLVTQRAIVHEDASMEWVDANLGSKLTMKYPSCYLVGDRAHGEILSMAFAGPGQHLDTGGKIIHGAPDTSSKIISKSVSLRGGRTSYRGLLKVYKGAQNSRSHVVCDALLMDDKSRSDTYPTMEIDENAVTIGHEATVSKVNAEQIFYLQNRGLSEKEAIGLVVGGFIEGLARELPMEFSIELYRLIQLQMAGSIG